MSYKVAFSLNATQWWFSTSVFLITAGTFIFPSCQFKKENKNKDITMQRFEHLRSEMMEIEPDAILREIATLCYADKDSTQTDHIVRTYYLKHRPFVWIDRYGISAKADTLLSYLERVENIGFKQESFDVGTLHNDLDNLRRLRFNKANSINAVMARLEYHLTKAFLRYSVGQRYGFTNPYAYLNRLDPTDTDSTGRAMGYRRLFDIDIKRPGRQTYFHFLGKVTDDSIGPFLSRSECREPAYTELKSLLRQTCDKHRRYLILINMERYRWRQTQRPSISDGRSIVVNIPAYHLYAYRPDSTLTMRIGCGSNKTKTPLLTSAIYRMDINPVWNIPMSITRKDIARHAGDKSYFERRGYYIVERSSGKRIDPVLVSASMLTSGHYRVTQEGGDGNALGRIIFRFDNNFSVYLHDTSSREVFSRNSRDVSHGCIRVEYPFELACFLLGDNADEWLVDKIRISMDMPPLSEKGIEYIEKQEEKQKEDEMQSENGGDEMPRPRQRITHNLIRSQNVSPHVPLYITYLTLFKTPDGKWSVFPDVYGYDALTLRQLKPFFQ